MTTEPITHEDQATPPEVDATPTTVDESGSVESTLSRDDARPATDDAAATTGVDEAGTEVPESSALETPVKSGRREALEHEGEIAADFLETLLDIADLDGDLEVNVEGDRAAVAIVDSEDGPAPKRLVGGGGAVLEALQELTRLAVQAETGDRSRLMLDVAGHRAGRRSELVELARRTCATVKESGERAELEPMSAFERKVVHDEVLAEGLISESEGAEPQRHVVILPQD